MTVIRGSHSGVSQLEAIRGTTTAAPGDTGVEFAAPNPSFGYLTIDPTQVDPDALLPSDSPADVIAALTRLAEAMIEDSDTDTGNSTIPPVYTYWGQFIDHDITAGTDRPGAEANALFSADILSENGFVPVKPEIVIGPNGIQNLRLPELDLDCVYGGDPLLDEIFNLGFFEDDRLRLKTGANIELSPDLTSNPDLPSGLNRDLPRKNRRALIADDRNDENLIVAQFHTAFLHFHNTVVKAMPGQSFAKVSEIVRWHYQWLIVNDFLPTLCKPAVVKKVLDGEINFFDSSTTRFMPLEFSVAGFRFGHSMIRAEYDFNKNFNPAVPINPPATGRGTFDWFFRFSGLKGNLEGLPQVPNNWIIEWDRFTDKNSTDKIRFARKIDTNLAAPLTKIPPDSAVTVEQATPGLTDIANHLAKRNLLRAYLLSIPTGQHVAKHLGVTPLTSAELIPQDKPNVKDVLESSGFGERTPLWYYILREAEREGGNSLGELGSRLVAGTLIGLLKSDRSSYLNANEEWRPTLFEGARPGIMDLFKFAGVA